MPVPAQSNAVRQKCVEVAEAGELHKDRMNEADGVHYMIVLQRGKLAKNSLTDFSNFARDAQHDERTDRGVSGEETGCTRTMCDGSERWWTMRTNHKIEKLFVMMGFTQV